jgi:signal transduction histidine kinase
MPIARKIVESHGGSVGVAPMESGNRFWIRIPGSKQAQLPDPAKIATP